MFLFLESKVKSLRFDEYFAITWTGYERKTCWRKKSWQHALDECGYATLASNARYAGWQTHVPRIH